MYRYHVIIVMVISTAESPASDSSATDRCLPYVLSMSLGQTDAESGVVIEADVLSRGGHCCSYSLSIGNRLRPFLGAMRLTLIWRLLLRCL
jgi:hypothetical protein